MRKIIAFEFITVNGMMLDPGDTFNWVKDSFDEEMLREISDQQNRVDTLLLGRLTYQLLANYRSTTNKKSIDSASMIFLNEVNKIIFSKTLRTADWKNSIIEKSIDAEKVKAWQKLPGQDMAIIGSASIVQAFINLRLINEFHFLIHPLTLAKGKPLFDNITDRHSLKPIKTKTFKNGVVYLCYQSSSVI
ncbi:MAG: dihydrofolate reductase [Chitinophagaceae bacterium]|nr:MAG: dihydrofolate reductase [Chitinophagaceae bacterium]